MIASDHHIETFTLSADGLLQLQGWALKTAAIHIHLDGGPLFALPCKKERNDVLDHFGLPHGSVYPGFSGTQFIGRDFFSTVFITTRSEERRVGKECRSRWSPYH